MIDDAILRSLLVPNDKKIVLLVIDGLGGLPRDLDGKTELEVAAKPNIDKLAARSACGLAVPVAPGITPGSGPAHLALFGYDPVTYQIGRGVLEALGIGMDVGKKDVAVRGNFATMDKHGVITDRRAGRLSTERNMALCQKLQREIPALDDVNVSIMHATEHRFVVVFRGDKLSEHLADTDPQREGAKALEPQVLFEEAERTASIVRKFVAKCNQALKDEHPANTVLLRGFSKLPYLPSFKDRYGLKAAAIAAYPMYRGLATCVGMTVLKTGLTVEEQFATLQEHYHAHDFFYLHVKKTDTYGEDGNFNAKVQVINELDAALPMVQKLGPDVLVITADHSTPAMLKGHSWHPVPLLLSARTAQPGWTEEFTERNCAVGTLGRFPSTDLMPLLLAHAGKLAKFGA
ncbi:MAG TPA: 2,3-bisphosphoglycerate-independent phosphoglycerate mutase [Candidatus Edwardsbacteria bacterium]|nr:2,3-bisphosphoglycerate-independent phosphoglycerate mutase [Candidatus Edwardsbacteria bacterium]